MIIPWLYTTFQASEFLLIYRLMNSLHLQPDGLWSSSRRGWSDTSPKAEGRKEEFQERKKKKGLYMQMKPRSRKRRRAVWMMKLVWETLQRVYLFRFKFPPNTYRKCFPCERNAWWPFNHYRTFFLSFSSRFPVLPFAFIPSTCWPFFIYMAFYPLCFSCIYGVCCVRELRVR